VFLYKELAELSSNFKIDFLKRDDKIISIKISDYSKNISVTLKDSFILLPSSLKKLSEQFNIETPKVIEPVYQGLSPEGAKYYQADISHYNKNVLIYNNLNI
jgi:DNA polymerase type B, organellar and viral